MDSIKHILLFFFIPLFLFGCKEKFTPKPRAYFRIDFPEKQYHPLKNDFPYQFEIPVYSKIEKDPYNSDKPFWINISVPANRAEIHISYYDLDNKTELTRGRLNEFLEETHELAYKHSIKADAIQEQVFMNPDKKVYGLIYRITGNAASPLQFFLTDSTTHFLRGALYISEVPNIDSLQPVIDFLEPDIVHLIETTTWK